MSQWFPNRQKSWIQNFCNGVLKQGPMPQHIGIIMDGNRRFAAKKSMLRAEGHLKGFDKLSETLEWCLNLGILEVTVFAFSIENFKRTQEEIDCLMELTRQKFQLLMQEQEMIEKHGVGIRVLGNLSLLPRDVQEIVAKTVDLTKHNSRAILNVCLPYSSRDDMCTAMKELAVGVKEGILYTSDVSEELLELCLSTAACRKVDLVIRTSGEVRLSDFLLWESSYSCLHFTPVLWPEFSVWHLYTAILKYQRNYNNIEALRLNMLSERERRRNEMDYQCVMLELTEKLSQNTADQPNLPEPTAAQVQEYAAARQQRVKGFLQSLSDKQIAFREKLLHPQTLPCTA